MRSQRRVRAAMPYRSTRGSVLDRITHGDATVRRDGEIKVFPRRVNFIYKG